MAISDWSFIGGVFHLLAQQFTFPTQSRGLNSLHPFQAYWKKSNGTFWTCGQVLLKALFALSGIHFIPFDRKMFAYRSVLSR